MKNTELTGMLKRLIWVALFFLVAAAVVYFVQKKRSTLVNQVFIEISGSAISNHNLLTPEDVRMRIERSFGHNLEGTPIGELNIERVERVLKEDAFTLDTEVFVDAENNVHISTKQREPILRLIDKTGEGFYFDEFGEKMPTSEHFSSRVLIATGNIPVYKADYQKKNGMLKHLFDLAQYIRTDEFLTVMIEHIYVNKENDIILVPKVGRQKIIFGKYEHIEDKFERLKLFYSEGIPYKGWQKYDTINLKYKGQVVCKKRRP